MHIDKQMNDFVISLLKTRIPVNYYYHNYEHTLYVMDKVIEIGRLENCTAKELKLLSVAAMWHDTGYINTYERHEEESCKLARQYLPVYNYSTDDINTICGMIMATKVPQSPQNKLEQIIADADLEYLGTSDAAVTAGLLYEELHLLDPLLTTTEWDKRQISFIEPHHYFTAYCKENKEPLKQAYLQGLRRRV